MLESKHCQRENATVAGENAKTKDTISKIVALVVGVGIAILTITLYVCIGFPVLALFVILGIDVVGAFVIARHQHIGRLGAGPYGIRCVVADPKTPFMRETIQTPTGEGDGGQAEQIPSLQLHTATCDWIALLTFYSVVKAFQSGQPIQPFKIADILFADQYRSHKRSDAFAALHVVMGIIWGLSGFLSSNSMIVERTQVTLKNLPHDFVEYMPKVLGQRIDECDEPYKSRLLDFKNEIDQYFERWREGSKIERG